MEFEVRLDSYAVPILRRPWRATLQSGCFISLGNHTKCCVDTFLKAEKKIADHNALGVLYAGAIVAKVAARMQKLMLPRN